MLYSMSEKACTKCQETKQFSLFSPHKGTKDKLQSWCKACVAAQTRMYNAEKMRLRMENPEYKAKAYEQMAKYRMANKEKVAAWKRAFLLRRRMHEKQVSPLWNKELSELVFIEAYDLAKLRKEIFNFSWDVDHIVPLNGRKAKGLHTACNIQVIPTKLNLEKSNKFIAGTDGQQLSWGSL